MSKCFNISIDGNRIPSQNISSFKLSLSVKSLLPIGEIIVNDKGGAFLAALSARIGSIVIVTLEDIPQEPDGKAPTLDTISLSLEPPVMLTPLVICRINGDNKATNESMSGTVILSLAHPWSIFKNFANHAYGASTLSALVQTLIEDKSRGYTIPTGRIDISDDTAGTPRYKCGVADDEFLTQVLLPFLVSDSHPMYSFIDDLGKYNLVTFETIYKDEATVALVPNISAWIAISEEFKEKNPTIKETANYSDLDLDIGGPYIRSMLSSLSPKVFFEDTVSGAIKSGILRKSFKLNNKNHLPINKSIMDIGPISNGYMYQYRTMEDAVSLMHSSARTLNELITIRATSSFVGTNLLVGSSVQVCVLPADSEQGAMHWLSGRYAIMEKTYYSEGEILEAKMLTTLSKPIVETDGSAIKDVANLYVG